MYFINVLFKSIIASVITGTTDYPVHNLLATGGGNRLSNITVIAVAAVVYVVLLLVLHIITKDDLQILPKDNKVVKFIGRFI